MQVYNMIVLALEAAVYFLFLITLLHWRHRIGIGVVITVLASMHFLETYVAATFYVSVPFATVSPGSAVLFTGKLLMVLLLYTKEDASTVRQLIYGLLVGNVMALVLAQLLDLHVAPVRPGGGPVDAVFLNDIGILMMWGTSLLYLDSIAVILLYERLGGLMGRARLPRFFAAGATVLVFDQIGFYGVLHWLTSAPASVFWGGLAAKMAMAILFVAMTGLYLRLFRADAVAAPIKGVGDVFADLTYRERYNELLARAGRDGLTGVNDRGRLEVEGPELVREGVRAGDGVGLMIIDADRFKDINDRYGHLRGDAVLRDIAAALTGTVRRADRVYRFGGEEFVVICRGLGPTPAHAAAERIRGEIGRIDGPDEGRAITVSIGLATAPEDGVSLLELLSAADRRLYRAKAEGRDRVVGD